MDWQLQALKTDYIDFGFIHCIDEQADWEKVLSGGTLEYIRELKKAGTVRHIGLSSHTPSIVERFLDEGDITWSCSASILPMITGRETMPSAA